MSTELYTNPCIIKDGDMEQNSCKDRHFIVSNRGRKGRQLCKMN